MTDHSSEFDFETTALHVGQEPDEGAGSTVPPIYMTSTFTQKGLNQNKGYEYTRVNNPNRDALERCIAALEGGEAGAAFSSGMGAIMAVLQSLRPGDTVIAGKDLYGGTWRALETMFKPWGLITHYAKNDSAEAFAEAVAEVGNPRLIWAESPTNPLLRITDLTAIAALRDSVPGCQMVVDNTFASPYLQKPLDFGADIVVHSLTKFLGGHSDVMGGTIVTRTKEGIAPYRAYQKTAGNTPSPFDCWLVQRGIKTLAVRMDRHCENAMKLAKALEPKSDFNFVLYPGLDSHPSKELAAKQMKNFGTVVTVEFKDSTRVPKFLENLKLFSLAEGLGGVESMVGYPAVMSHGSLGPEMRAKRGISDGLVRLSVGIESFKDILGDIEQALGEC